MQVPADHAALLELVHWIDVHTAGLRLPADERSQLAIGCFDVALEHQASVTVLHSTELYGSMLALVRVLSEAVVRGLWLHACATKIELSKFKRGKLDKKFSALIHDYESKIGTPGGVLSGFKLSAWTQLNDFTHTGFLQISRRHKPGRLEASYPDQDLKNGLGVAGALGLIAAGQLIALAGRDDLVTLYFEKMSAYAQPSKT